MRDDLLRAAEACGLVKDDGRQAALRTIASGMSAGKAKPETFDSLRAKREAEAAHGEAQARALMRLDDGSLADAVTGEIVGEAPALTGWAFDGEAPAAPQPMLVKRLLPANGIAFVGGQSGAGKTYIAVDLAVALASQTDFFGFPVRERVGVVIVAGEGAGTIMRRVAAASEARVLAGPLPIARKDFVGDLKKLVEADHLIAELRAVNARFRAEHGVRLGVVIIDTLAACFALEDENSNAEASKAIAAMKRVADALGVVVAPVHHYGKGVETGLRGASAWRAGADVVLSVLARRDETTGHVDGRRLCLAKSRTDVEGGEIPFELRAVPLGVDEDGEQIFDCHVEASHRGAGGGEILTGEKMAKALKGDARLYLDALGVALAEAGRRAWPYGAEGHEVVAVDREAVRREFYARKSADGDDRARLAAKQKAFRRGEGKAREAGRSAGREIGDEHLVWLTV